MLEVLKTRLEVQQKQPEALEKRQVQDSVDLGGLLNHQVDLQGDFARLPLPVSVMQRAQQVKALELLEMEPLELPRYRGKEGQEQGLQQRLTPLKANEAGVKLATEVGTASPLKKPPRFDGSPPNGFCALLAAGLTGDAAEGDAAEDVAIPSGATGLETGTPPPNPPRIGRSPPTGFCTLLAAGMTGSTVEGAAITGGAAELETAGTLPGPPSTPSSPPSRPPTGFCTLLAAGIKDTAGTMDDTSEGAGTDTIGSTDGTPSAGTLTETATKMLGPAATLDTGPPRIPPRRPPRGFCTLLTTGAGTEGADTDTAGSADETPTGGAELGTTITLLGPPPSRPPITRGAATRGVDISGPGKTEETPRDGTELGTATKLLGAPTMLDAAPPRSPPRRPPRRFCAAGVETGTTTGGVGVDMRIEELGIARADRSPPRAFATLLAAGAEGTDITGVGVEILREELGTIAEGELGIKGTTNDERIGTTAPADNDAPTDTVTPMDVPGRALEGETLTLGSATGETEVEAALIAVLGNKLLTTPTGTNAITPLLVPRSPPRVFPSPFTVFAMTPVTPFNVQVLRRLSYVAPTQYGLPTHASTQTVRLGVRLVDRVAWSKLLLQMTW
ncbi:hypothetical protein N0V90_012957 [Kalmusia sp. IMI 367209]|nr:hypothetical protein N0V90_012957 [Kalmusia sp. IMI 367209]